MSLPTWAGVVSLPTLAWVVILPAGAGVVSLPRLAWVGILPAGAGVVSLPTLALVVSLGSLRTCSETKCNTDDLVAMVRALE